ncbi:MAG: amidohydrolase family protein [Acidimicrobiales bacterium]
MPATAVWDAHRHLGALPSHRFYGGPPVVASSAQLASVAELIAALDADGTERAVVLPNYGVPDPDVAFGFNELCLEAAANDDRIRAALWTSARPDDAERTEAALALAAESGVVALKLSFLLGGSPTDPACRPQLDRIFATALENDLVVHVHTSPGGPRTSTRSGTWSTGTATPRPSTWCTWAGA